MRMSTSGYTLVEVILAVTLFALMATSFSVALREHDKLLKRADQYSVLNMQMDRLASMIRNKAPSLDDSWQNEADMIRLKEAFDLKIIDPEEIIITATVDSSETPADPHYTLNAQLYAVNAHESVKKFSKRVLVIEP